MFRSLPLKFAACFLLMIHVPLLSFAEGGSVQTLLDDAIKTHLTLETNIAAKDRPIATRITEYTTASDVLTRVDNKIIEVDRVAQKVAERLVGKASGHPDWTILQRLQTDIKSLYDARLMLQTSVVQTYEKLTARKLTDPSKGTRRPKMTTTQPYYRDFQITSTGNDGYRSKSAGVFRPRRFFLGVFSDALTSRSATEAVNIIRIRQLEVLNRRELGKIDPRNPERVWQNGRIQK